MSNKNREITEKRPYRQRARARRRDQVHRRITLAAIQLHGSIGPARTTMGEIARLAGVRRATVYNHFASDKELFDACSTHWFGENPPPDATAWAKIADPARRMRVALGELYDYYDHGREMLGNVLRDSPLLPALGEIMHQKWLPLMDQMIAVLSEGWKTQQSGGHGAEPGPVADSQVDKSELNAILRVALDFFTWQTLKSSGLSNEKAAQAAGAWIEAVGK